MTESDLVRVVFETDLGPIGLVDSSSGLIAIRVGYASAEELTEVLATEYPEARAMRLHALAPRLMAFASGTPDDFLDVELDDAGFTPFRKRVTAVCRAIPRGVTVSYAELARRSGKPDAARAAGNVMARNPWPILVPCHRVVASDGGLGGYSAPRGLEFKEQLLRLESTWAGAAGGYPPFGHELVNR